MGQFDWFAKIGATPQAVAVLNDQPVLFFILLAALGALALQGGVIFWIHKATFKPEQAKKKTDKKAAPAKGAALPTPPALRK